MRATHLNSPPIERRTRLVLQSLETARGFESIDRGPGSRIEGSSQAKKGDEEDETVYVQGNLFNPEKKTKIKGRPGKIWRENVDNATDSSSPVPSLLYPLPVILPG